MFHPGYLVVSLIVIGMAAAFYFRRLMSVQMLVYFVVTGTLLAAGITMVWLIPHDPRPWVISLTQNFGWRILGVGAASLVFGLVEFGFLRFVGLFRLGAITRVTYYEALFQPFTMIVVGAGIAVIIVCGYLQYFTVDQDHQMFRDVALSFAFMFTLPIMIFASTKVIDEEIENRTMLTLMSKPIARWQVVLGKYFGVLLLCFAVIAVLGITGGVSTYIRYFDDKMTDFYTALDPEKERLLFLNDQALRAMVVSLVLEFLQVATLAAVSVAVSTRFGLAVNITTVVMIYIAANMVQYATGGGLPGYLQFPMSGVASVLPGLNLLDLNQRLVYGNFSYGKEVYPGWPLYSEIWQYVGLSAVYATFYVAAALSFGIALFRTRELT